MGMRSEKVSGLVVVLLVVVGSVGAAMGQDVSDGQMRAFEEHVRRGGAHLQDERYAEAVEELERARAIIDHPRVAVTIGRAYEQWGQCVEARKRARELGLREDLDAGSQRVVVELMSSTRVCAQSGRVILRCDPGHASVGVVGGASGTCPFDRELTAGGHRLEVSAEGYESVTSVIELDALETKEVEIKLRPSTSLADGVGAGASGTPRGWMSIAGYGAIGTGAVLLGAGLISDMGASGRIDAMLAADTPEQLRTLEDEAARARTRTYGLYGAGAVLAAGGGALLWLSRDGAGAAGAGSAGAGSAGAARSYWVHPLAGGVGAGVRMKW